LKRLSLNRTAQMRPNKTQVSLPALPNATKKQACTLAEVARALVRLDRIASRIVNADHRGVRLHPTNHSGVGQCSFVKQNQGFRVQTPLIHNIGLG